MDRAWLIDSRGLAKKVINASLPAEDQLKDCGASRHCPNCFHLIDNSDASQEWPGLPAGVKFEPSEVELLDHLAAKQGEGGVEPHVYIDEFIPTLQGDKGICYTHPENLPGAKKDGSCIHFFYRISKAYASGKRKRRRIQDQESTINGHVRWHKTGKTRPVMENGVQKGFKKIMVLYAASKKGSKPGKCNWVMHQYHLGADEDEKDGELVVSKIFYQPHKESESSESSEKNESSLVTEESDVKTVHLDPKTPKTDTPDLSTMEKTPSSDWLSDDYFTHLFLQETDSLKEPFNASCDYLLEDETEYTVCLAENGEAYGLSRPNHLTCKEAINLSSVHEADNKSCCGIEELHNLELDTPPDFKLNELTFASQDSIFDWLDQN